MASYTQFTMQGINLLLALISAYTILNKNKMHFDDEKCYFDPDRLVNHLWMQMIAAIDYISK